MATICRLTPLPTTYAAARGHAAPNRRHHAVNPGRRLRAAASISSRHDGNSLRHQRPHRQNQRPGPEPFPKLMGGHLELPPSDVNIGPRLTGSPNSNAPMNGPAKTKLESWGLTNAHLEPVRPSRQAAGRSNGFSAQVIEPQCFPLVAYPLKPGRYGDASRKNGGTSFLPDPDLITNLDQTESVHGCRA